jgi:arylsulfatase A-like enzyme
MLFVNYLEPHLEYRPPEQYANKFLPDSVSFDEAMDANQDAWQYIAGKVEMTDRDFDVLRALYDAEINYLDEQIASLVASLKEADEWEDTVCVIVGDHGENIGDHGLMDHQYSLYETLVNVPLIVHGRGFGGNSTVDQLVQLTDIPPTLLDVAGVDETAFNSECQGKPLPSPAAPSTREFTVSEYLAPQPSMSALQRRVGELPPEVYQYDTSLRAIRTHEWKLVRQEDGSTELYDLSEDAMEIENVVDEYGDIAETLEEQLDQWLDSFEHATPGTGAEMSEETKNRLEELGYLQ